MSTTDFDIRKTRERYPWKPGDTAIYKGSEVEVLSYPYPSTLAEGEIRVFARLTPGDSTTLKAIPCEGLSATLSTMHKTLSKLLTRVEAEVDALNPLDVEQVFDKLFTDVRNTLRSLGVRR